MGAIEKKNGTGDVRVIHDGTHGVLVNNKIRVRDRMRFPVVGDIQSVLHEASAERCGHFMILYDIRKAHRTIPVREGDWGYQACRVDGQRTADGRPTVWLNKVGTFGISSAAYWFGRVAGAVLRLGHYVAGGFSL